MRKITGVVTVMAALALVACNSASVTQTSGIVTVGVSSSGPNADTVFGISVDNGYLTYDITTGKDLTFSVTTGSYSVQLTDVASHCTVDGDNPRSVSVTAGGSTDVSFLVTCNDDGMAKVTVSTTGEDLDDQYSLVFDDGAKSVLVGPNQFVTVGMASGSHTVEMQGVADNCAVQGDNPVAFDIPAEGVGTASFAVVCTAR